ncbi:MAG: PGF-pre-PGF domain-containing protein, partial [Candidatus Aenigmarchaeota archaeon]|nr:PGF-pre-PGF domain-containing protein [Candidatus Aenigmarchaeota archaeon]
ARLTPTEEGRLEISANVSFIRFRIRVNKEVTNVKLRIERIGEPENVPKLGKKIYGYFEITLSNIGDALDEATLEFKVEKSWINENNLDPTTVTLYKFDGEWVGMPTELTNEDEDFYYYVSTVHGFSTFAIAAEERSVPTTTTTTVEQEEKIVETTTTTMPQKEEVVTEKEAYSTVGIIPIIAMIVVAILLIALLVKKLGKPKSTVKVKKVKGTFYLSF